MTPEQLVDVDHELHDTMVDLVRRHGPQSVEWLVARARRERRDARIDERLVIRTIESSTILVPGFDGDVGWLGDALDGIVLTHRARAPLAGRRDLWCGLSMQPLLNLAAFSPLPLTGGGEVVRMETGHDVLVGPSGWLPDVRRRGLVALRWSRGTLSVEAVDEADLPALEETQAARALIADHYRRERWWHTEDDLESRPGELVRALTLARMEDPDLLGDPHPPLDELLYNPLQRDVDEHHWRDFAAAHQSESVSRWLGYMPVALDIELSARARRYGMSFDQYVIAVLGHLAWRTPFAEDCGPFEDWDPESDSRGDATVAHLPGADEVVTRQEG